jgi:hypothetical protein
MCGGKSRLCGPTGQRPVPSSWLTGEQRGQGAYGGLDQGKVPSLCFAQIVVGCGELGRRDEGSEWVSHEAAPGVVVPVG